MTDHTKAVQWARQVVARAGDRFSSIALPEITVELARAVIAMDEKLCQIEADDFLDISAETEPLKRQLATARKLIVRVVSIRNSAPAIIGDLYYTRKWKEREQELSSWDEEADQFLKETEER